MAMLSAPAELSQAFDEDAWEGLLDCIEEHRVVPIIGPDLLRVQNVSGLIATAARSE